MVVYLAQCAGTDLYKIGCTRHKDPNKRLKQLQTGNASELILISSFETSHGFKLETALHNRFKVNKQEGEWFELNLEQVRGFVKLCEEKEKVLTFLIENNSYLNRNDKLY